MATKIYFKLTRAEWNKLAEKQSQYEELFTQLEIRGDSTGPIFISVPQSSQQFWLKDLLKILGIRAFEFTAKQFKGWIDDKYRPDTITDQF